MHGYSGTALIFPPAYAKDVPVGTRFVRKIHSFVMAFGISGLLAFVLAPAGEVYRANTSVPSISFLDMIHLSRSGLLQVRRRCENIVLIFQSPERKGRAVKGYYVKTL
jgi:hypothetical protein